MTSSLFKIPGVLMIAALSLAVIGLIATSSENFLPAAPTSRVIEAGPSGFKPASLVIREGETVVFRSVGRATWPAGDFHPEHSLYPEFDPKAPVEDGREWTFRFDKPGEWTFHDHLSPSDRGIIRVVGSSEETLDCGPSKDEHRPACWDKELSRLLDTQGLPAAFAYFAQLYATEPAFVAGGCHWQAHKLGEKAAAEFIAKKPVEITPATAYCGFGFFHGFLQILLREDGSLGRAKEFCEEVTREIGEGAPRARLNCYHGIGHGLVEDPPPPQTWGDTEAVLAEPLKVCLTISEAPLEIKECSDGVYNALLIIMESGKYGFTLPENPLSFCQTQPDVHLRSCFYEFSQKLDRYAKWDLKNIPAFLKDIDSHYLEMIINNGVAGIIQRDISLPSFSSHAAACRLFPAEGREGCLKGIVGGLMAHGEPEKEYVKAFAFCGEGSLFPAERTTCYAHFIESAGQMYSASKMEAICAELPGEFRSLCKN